MTTFEFICPECSSGLQQRGHSYYCPECLREYALYSAGDVSIIDFKSLDAADCECNRDGKTVCKIELGQVLSQRRKEPKSYTGGRHRLIEGEFGTGNRILDLGCAEGPYSYLFTRENESYGLDTCPQRLLLNEDNAIGKGYRALILGEGLDLPFADASFDIVLCTEVVEHVVEVRQLIKEINRVLKQGGRLILTTPNLVCLGNRIGIVLGKGLKFNPLFFRRGGFFPLVAWPLGSIPGKQYSFDSIRYPEQPLHFRFFTFESLRKLLRYSGFSVNEEVGRGPVISRFPRFVSRLFKNWADDILVVATKD